MLYMVVRFIYYVLIETANTKRKTIMNNMTITIATDDGFDNYFKIEFKDKDFMRVVDAIDDVTMDNVYNNPLWKVV